MKKTLLSIFSCALCAVYILSPFTAFAEGLDWAIVVVETAINELIRSSDTDYDSNIGLTGIEKQIINNAVIPSMIKNGVIVDNGSGNELKLTVGGYKIVTGKYQLTYTLADYDSSDNESNVQEYATLIECTILMPQDTGGYIPATVGIAQDTNTGRWYFANALNFTVTHSNGNVEKFVCKYKTNMYNHINAAIDSISIDNADVDVYSYTGKLLQSSLYTDVHMSYVQFKMMDVNSITVPLSTIIIPSSSDKVNRYATGFSKQSGNTVTPHKYLTIQDISSSSTGVLYDHDVSYVGSAKWKSYGFSMLNYLFTSFYITNDSSDYEVIQRNWTDNSKKNYYYDNRFYEGAVVDNSNKTTIFNGGLAPAFDVDTDLPLLDIVDLLTDLLPDLEANLAPSVGVNIDDLFGKLLDFYGNMPDINLPWNVDPELNNNNYFDIALPDSGGGGSGGDNIVVTVDVNITRPLVTTYTYEDPIEIETLPIISTYTMPVEVTDRTSEILSNTTSFLNNIGLIPIYAFLTLIGIGVAIIFKGV